MVYFLDTGSEDLAERNVHRHWTGQRIGYWRDSQGVAPDVC
jgi:hypothetical protein